MLQTIKSCFTMYYDNVKNIIKCNKVYDVETMTVTDIENEIDIIHMKYILGSTFSISPTSIQCMSYTHLKNIIDQYYDRYGYDDNEVSQPESIIVQEEIPQKKTRSGWFQ